MAECIYIPGWGWAFINPHKSPPSNDDYWVRREAMAKLRFDLARPNAEQVTEVPEWAVVEISGPMNGPEEKKNG